MQHPDILKRLNELLNTPGIPAAHWSEYFQVAFRFAQLQEYPELRNPAK